MTEQKLKQELKSYKENLARLKMLTIKLEEKYKNDGMKGMSYDNPKLSPSYAFNSATENTAEQNMSDYDKLIKDYGMTEGSVMLVEIVLSALNEVERTIVECKYIEGLDWIETAEKVSYSKSHTRKIGKGSAMQKMLNVLQ